MPPVVPDFDLLRRIGRGSYGDVWLARSVTGQSRAIKVVYRDRFESDRPFEREFAGIQKFEKISRQNPSQLDVLHVGHNGSAGFFYYVMELADAIGASPDAVGQPIDPATYEPCTLKALLLQMGHLPANEALDLAVILTEALHELHSSGLIHRDIKPSNIIFIRGRPKLADIGLITAAEASVSFVGTEGFVPRDGPGTAGADLFALGKTIYEAATGNDRMDFPRLPERFEDRPDRGLLMELNEVWLQACDPDPKHRYSSAADLRNDLVLLKARKSVRRLRALERQVRRSRRLIVFSFIVAILVAFNWWQSHRFNRTAAAQLAHVYVQHGQERLEQGDTIGALPWFAAAMDLESYDKQREAAHRQRVANTLSQSPELVHLSAYTADPMPRHVFFDQSATRALICEPGPEAQVWDIGKGAPLTPKLDHDAPVRRGWFNATGSRVATLSGSGWLRLWDAATGKLQGSPIAPETGSAGACFSPDGRCMFAAGSSGRVTVWDMEGRLLREKSIGLAIDQLAISGNGSVLAAVCNSQKRILVIDAATLETRFAANEDLATVGVIALDETGTHLVAGNESGIVEEWNLIDGTAKRGWQLQLAGPVFRLKFNNEGTRLLAGSEHSVGVFGATDGRPVFPTLNAVSAFRVLEWSPSQTRLLVGGESRTAQILNADDGTPLTAPLRQAGEIAIGRFVGSDDEWVTASADRTTRLWASATAERNALRFSHATNLVEAWLIPNQNRLLTLDVSGVPTRWSWISNQVSQATGNSLGAVKAALLTGDGATIVAMNHRNELQVFEADSMVSVARWVPDVSCLGGAMAVGHKRSQLFAGGKGRFFLWNWRTGETIDLSNGGTGEAVSAQFSPDDGIIAVAISTGELLIWRVGAITQSPLKLSLSDRPSFLAFTKASDRLLVATEDRSFQWWNPMTGQPLSEQLHAEATVNFARVSGDATRVFTAGFNFEAVIWDAMQGRPLTRPFRPAAQIVDVSFSPDASEVALLDRKGAVQVWQVDSGEPATPVFRGRAPATAVSYSADGRYLMVVENGRDVVLHPMTTTVPSAAELNDRAALVSSLRLDQNGLPQPLELNELCEIARRLHVQ